MKNLIRLAVLISLSLVRLDAVEIKTAYTRHYAAGEIRTVSQYFGASLIGQRFRTIVASQPDQPSGQYFITRISGAREAPPAMVRMTLYTTDSKEPSEWTWDLKGIRPDNWLYLGLTGQDWPDEDILPLAWRIELLDQDGNTVADWKSFLWDIDSNSKKD